MTLQVPDLELAKIRLKCLELAASADQSATISRAARLVAWVVRDRTARTERSAMPEPPAPGLPERLASFKLGMEEMARRCEAAGVKPSLIDKAKSTLGLKPKVK